MAPIDSRWTEIHAWTCEMIRSPVGSALHNVYSLSWSVTRDCREWDRYCSPGKLSFLCQREYAYEARCDSETVSLTISRVDRLKEKQKASVLSFGKFRSPYLGKKGYSKRESSAIPTPTSVGLSSNFVCRNQGIYGCQCLGFLTYTQNDVDSCDCMYTTASRAT